MRGNNDEASRIDGIAETAIGNLAGIAGGLATVGTAVSLVVSELEKAKRIAETAIRHKGGFPVRVRKTISKLSGRKAD